MLCLLYFCYKYAYILITNRPGQSLWLLSFNLFPACCHFIFPLIRFHRRARARLVSASRLCFPRDSAFSCFPPSFVRRAPHRFPSPFPPSVVGFFRSVSAYRFGFPFSFPLAFVPRGGVVCFRVSSIFPSPLPAYTFRPRSTDASSPDSIRSRFEPRRVDSNRKGAGEWSLTSDGRRRWNEARSKGLTGKGRGVPETEICGENDTKR